jgi:hypothetical protein
VAFSQSNLRCHRVFARRKQALLKCSSGRDRDAAD